MFNHLIVVHDNYDGEDFDDMELDYLNLTNMQSYYEFVESEGENEEDDELEDESPFSSSSKSRRPFEFNFPQRPKYKYH